MIHNSKYVFFGTPEFAAIVLDKLISAGFPPSAVVCNPDRPVGRKKIITPPATKSQIMVRGSRFMDEIKILQPEKLDSGFEHQISNIKPEFGIVAAYAKIIPKNIIELFPKGVIGVHPSLLPKYRGASPIQSAILDGEKEAGVTLYLLDEKMDHGPILEQRELEFPISNFQF
ncbi:MAG: methionyl-tRNA formyltransferase, partial [Candidatus Liptonbacteria bacterium]|nr:methionyl-tRNA formyltransferase [Candidatus Liptonbacteria bacterium]